MRSSEIYKALVGLDDGTVTHCDAVEYDETIWLVPRWIDVPQEGFRRPERLLIRSDVIPTVARLRAPPAV